MKKLMLVVCVLGFAVLTAQAQGIARLANAEAKMDQDIAAQKKQRQTQTKQNTGAKVDKVIVKALQEIKASTSTQKEEILLLGKRATKVLELLQLDNRQYEKEFGDIIKEHNALLEACKESNSAKDESLIVQNIYLSQEAVLNAVDALSAKNSTLGATANTAVNHLYWIELKQEGYRLVDISSLAHSMFPDLQHTERELK